MYVNCNCYGNVVMKTLCTRMLHARWIMEIRVLILSTDITCACFYRFFFPIIERVTSPSTLMSVRWSFIILLKGGKLHFQRSYRKTCFFLLRKCSNNLSRKILRQGGGVNALLGKLFFTLEFILDCSNLSWL